jgi:RNA methyltransferase, TrmH family
MKKPRPTNTSFQDEQKYYGIHACFTLWKMRPDDVIRVYIHESNMKFFSPVLKWCAQHKKAYHVVSNDELGKITGSVHHEGICILAKELKNLNFVDCLKQLKSDKICLLYLDGVQNPHNIGSILRSCAHFNIPFILGDQLPTLSPSACRIAKGGAEYVRLVNISEPKKALEDLAKRGFKFIGTSSHGGVSLYKSTLPARTVFAFGNESSGMSEAMLKSSHMNIQIPGTGHVESLNVSVATSLCLGEYARQHS